MVRHRPFERSTQKGFTLVELMIVVAILAILASIAIVGYSKYVKSVRVSEAEAFLSSIAAKQEQYRARFGTYTSAAANPATEPGATQKLPWNNAISGWASLGAKPKGTHVSFQYETRGGGASTACTAPNGIPTACNAQMSNRTWFWVTARNEAFFVIYNSERPQPWVLER